MKNALKTDYLNIVGTGFVTSVFQMDLMQLLC